MSETPEPEDKPGLVLGIFLAGLFVALLGGAIYLNFLSGGSFSTRHSLGHHDMATASMGIYLMYVGLLSLLSYWFSHATFFLRWVTRLLENAQVYGPGVSYTPGRKAAFIFGPIFLIVGGMVFIWAMGWF